MTKTEAVTNAAIYILRHLNTHGDLNVQRETQTLISDIDMAFDAPAVPLPAPVKK